MFPIEKKKWMAILFIFALVIFFSGSDSSGAAKKVIKIGNVCPYTGFGAPDGIGMKNSVDLHIRQANASGEFPNVEFQLLALDDAGDPATGVNMATKLGSDPDVIGVSGHWNSPVALATAPIFHRFGLLNIVNCVHPDVIRGNDFKEVMRMIPDILQEQAFGGDFAVNKLGYKNWVIIHDTTAWGKSRLEWFTKDLQGRPGTKLLSADAINVGTKDFRPILTRIKELKPDAIFGGLLVQEIALLKLQMAELGMTNVFLWGVPGVESPTFIEMAGKAAEGMVLVAEESVALDSDFVKAYKAAGFAQPYEAFGPFAYDVAGVVIQAYKAVGSNRKAIVDFVNDPKFVHQGATGVIRFKDRQRVGGLILKVCQDGKWTVFEKSEYATGKRKLPGK